MSAANRTVLVTGAASGIGAATARRLSSAGDSVFLVDRDPAVARVAAELPGAQALVHDLADPAAAAAVCAQLTQHAAGLDALVNAAGVATGSDDAILEVNFSAALRLTRALVPMLRASRCGRILNVGSIQANRAGTESVAYAASKAALHAATRALAVDLAADGILVNAVAPGFVDTAMSVLPDGRTEFDTEWFREVYIDHARLPLRRPASADEIAAVIALILSPDNTYMTGSVVAIDGGLGAAL